MDKTLLAVEALTVKFGKFKALDTVSFALQTDAGVVGLIGPNGAGKTTLIQTILKQNRAQGKLTVNCKIAYCPDMPEFEKQYTPVEVLAQALYLNGAKFERQRVFAILKRVGLAQALDRPNGGFSRGMKQRLGIAVALVLDPEVIFLDEPTSALDPLGRKEILTLIKEIAKEKVVVVSSHLLVDIQNIATHLLVLNEGHLLYQGKTKDFLATYDRLAVLKLEANDLLRATQYLAKAKIKVTVVKEEASLYFEKENLAKVMQIVLAYQLKFYFCGVDDNGLERAFENIVQHDQTKKQVSR